MRFIFRNLWFDVVKLGFEPQLVDSAWLQVVSNGNADSHLYVMTTEEPHKK